MKLAAINLNLLLAFQALVEERQVTRAAQRIGLSQSAMSHALARLRQMFNDELLVPTPHGMQLTAKATALAGPVRTALMQLEGALDDESTFDPQQTTCTFMLAMSDINSLLVLPRLQRLVSEHAPGINLVVLSSAGGRGLDMLDRGEADLAIGRFLPAPPCLHAQVIYRDQLVCFARADHPAFARKLSIDTYLALPHLLVQKPNDVSFVDLALAHQGMKRQVVLTLPHYLVAPAVLSETNLVATESERLAMQFKQWMPVAIQAAPFDIPLTEVAMAWHNRLDRNSAHCWLRQQIANLVADE